MSEGQKKRVKVYLRTCQKHAKVVELPSKVTGRAIYEEVENRLHLHADQVHLFLKGVLIKEDSSVSLSDKSIVHVVETGKLEGQEELKIFIKTIDSSEPRTFKVQRQMKIKDFIDKELQRSERVVLLYLGKEMETDKTFHDSQVINGAEIIFLDSDAIHQLKNNKKHETNSYHPHEHPQKRFTFPESRHAQLKEGLVSLSEFEEKWRLQECPSSQFAFSDDKLGSEIKSDSFSSSWILQEYPNQPYTFPSGGSIVKDSEVGQTSEFRPEWRIKEYPNSQFQFPSKAEKVNDKDDQSELREEWKLKEYPGISFKFKPNNLDATTVTEPDFKDQWKLKQYPSAPYSFPTSTV